MRRVFLAMFAACAPAPAVSPAVGTAPTAPGYSSAPMDRPFPVHVIGRAIDGDRTRITIDAGLDRHVRGSSQLRASHGARGTTVIDANVIRIDARVSIWIVAQMPDGADLEVAP